MITRDRRFDEAGWATLTPLIRMIDRWLNTQILSEEQIWRAWSARANFEMWDEEAERAYPVESRDLRTILPQWRARVRESIPKWLRQ